MVELFNCKKGSNLFKFIYRGTPDLSFLCNVVRISKFSYVQILLYYLICICTSGHRKFSKTGNLFPKETWHLESADNYDFLFCLRG